MNESRHYWQLHFDKSKQLAVVVAAAAVADHSATDDTASADGMTQRSAVSPSSPAGSAVSSPAGNLQAA